jgi:hypothetical protein
MHALIREGAYKFCVARLSRFADSPASPTGLVVIHIFEPAVIIYASNARES